MSLRTGMPPVTKTMHRTLEESPVTFDSIMFRVTGPNWDNSVKQRQMVLLTENDALPAIHLVREFGNSKFQDVRKYWTNSAFRQNDPPKWHTSQIMTYNGWWHGKKATQIYKMRFLAFLWFFSVSTWISWVSMAFCVVSLGIPL